MPRLYRESPLNSIWEGSGNVQCLDVLRAMVTHRRRRSRRFFAEVDEAAGADPRLDATTGGAARRADRPRAIEARARRRRRADGARRFRARCWCASATEAVADAFCASRLGGDWGHAFGTLPAGTDLVRIIDRHCAAG